MGHPTYEQLLEMLVSVRDADYRSDPERHEARIDNMERILQSMLEKLRDAFDPSGTYSDPFQHQKS